MLPNQETCGLIALDPGHPGSIAAPDDQLSHNFAQVKTKFQWVFYQFVLQFGCENQKMSKNVIMLIVQANAS